jgi:CRISPR-associated protein Cst2
MPRTAQIAVLARISGNVNADEVIGQRITLKRFYTSEGEVKPFISARAVKYAIRQALAEKGLSIDPFQLTKTKPPRLIDSGDPVKYVDNDLFGFMAAERREELARRRQAPIALSYLRALKNTAIKAEFALRAPRPQGTTGNPLPFEVEVAEWIGRLDCLVYDYVGVYQGTESERAKQMGNFVSNEERKKRLGKFLEVFLTPSYVLPRRTNSLVIPEYVAALVTLSEKGPWPIYQYLDNTSESGKVSVDIGLLNGLRRGTSN